MVLPLRVCSCLVLLLGSSLAQTNNAGTIANDKNLTQFNTLLNQAGISPSIGKTVLAPDNTAFSAWSTADPMVYQYYTSQADWFVHLSDVLLWHLVTQGAFTTSEIFNGNRLTLENTLYNITVDQRFKTLDGVPLTSFAESNISTAEGYLDVLNQVIIPPFLTVNLIETMLNEDISWKFAYSTMANLALYTGLDQKINDLYDKGITFLVPPNQRFNRAQINVPKLMTPAMMTYTTDFVLCHLIMDIYYEAGIFAYNKQNIQEQFVVKSELGTDLWITTTASRLRFQSREVLVTDQTARNGIFHVMDLPLFPPFISDFTDFTAISTTWDTSDCYRFFRQTLLSSQDISKMFNSTLTMFCPTHTAFTSFNRDDFNRLLEPTWVRHATEFLLNMFTKPALTQAELLARSPSMITMLNGQSYELKRSGDIPRIKNTAREQARVSFGDLIAMDGYLQITDAPITPTAVSESIYVKSQDNPDFSLLVTNIDFVQLNTMIDQQMPLTLLAPNNAAFRRIKFGTLDGATIIKRHLITGLYFCDVIANQTQYMAVNGDTIGVELRGAPGSGLWGTEGQHLFVGGAYVYNCDIFARNGVLHHIDRVIGEPYNTVSPTVTPAPSITGKPTVYVAPTAAPVEIPTGFAPIALPPVLPGVVPSAKIADATTKQPVAAPSGASRGASWALSSVLLLLLAATGL